MTPTPGRMTAGKVACAAAGGALNSAKLASRAWRSTGGPSADPAASDDEDTPHYHGHRDRLRTRFMEAGPAALADYELLELVLFNAIPQRDVKPLAKTLIDTFRLVRRNRSRPIRSVSAKSRDVAPRAIVEFKIVEAGGAALRQGRRRRSGCRWAPGTRSSTIAARRWRSRDREIFRILFLDKKNGLIADEVQGAGTVDHTPVYPREVVRRALELSATAIVLVHNHPSGDPTPSSRTSR